MQESCDWKPQPRLGLKVLRDCRSSEETVPSRKKILGTGERESVSLLESSDDIFAGHLQESSTSQNLGETPRKP